MVGAGVAVRGDEFAGEGPEPPLHPVADDCASDFLADRKADAHPRVVVAAVADEEHESGSRGTPTGVRGEEIRAFLENRWRF